MQTLEVPNDNTRNYSPKVRDQARAFQEEALDAVPQAIKAILAILNEPATPAALRLRAAGMILKMADVKSAAQERETKIVMQPGVRIIHADPSAASAPPRQSLNSHPGGANPETSKILHNSAQRPAQTTPPEAQTVLTAGLRAPSSHNNAAAARTAAV
jgi:hypothetical protein